MSFNEIYHSYNKLVYNLALQYVQNSEDAKEITQDTFVAIHQSLKSFEGKSQLSTWIYRITINKCLDFIKTQKRKKRFAIITSIFNESSEEIKHDLHTFDHPGVLLEQKEEISVIFRLINSLPDSQKTALILSKIEQKSQKEIAEIMNISPKAVESLVQRAKTQLSKKLKEAKDL
jgi:RNA polymerase sigma-70 factor (family 1)